ncbi:TIGR02281 family clan AA aspartic protease [Pseudacidovorax sp. RU35E]|uniref:retropepsin-like aspartic protease family protein n=1 Tax=Pseudacidovorax sp. RU35E TaxID=1907403 RepID=UPI000954982F|nr:TIGR02281 family clan AA aspartic protease [Pseudacidovorax sp. RU35E]SIQ98804.1 aspartyl protease family protein [Pseudacidovorax sp. RU35E]
MATGLAVTVQAQAQAQTQSITLTGTIGSRAILIVGGGAPRTLAAGESLQGVRLVSVQDGQAIVESGGKRLTLRMGAPASVGGSGGGGGGGSRIVLTADSRGHFVTAGGINSRPVTFMLDTGATSVGMSMADAQRIGLDPTRGQPVTMNTANGTVPGWRVKLESVKVGDVTVYDVDAIVSPQPMPYVLLGNSFINRFSMRRDADQMVLERRY